MNIGVTGGMGAGKSKVAKALAEQLGAMSVSADSICRDILAVGRPGYQQMRNNFSADFFSADGSINRPFLRKVIFSDKMQRAKLDGLLHPLVRKELLTLREDAMAKGMDLVAEVPLLFEKGWQSDFDCTLVVYADDEICVNRIMRRDQVSREDAQKSIASQMSLVEKCKLGDWIIDNSGSFAVTLELIERFKEKVSGDSLFQREK